jgi:hypothetical protein
MVQKFDSTANERGTTATIPHQYYVPKKSEEYWLDVVDEGIGKSGRPNKTRRDGLINLLEDVARKNALIRLGMQRMLAHDPSASGIVALRNNLIAKDQLSGLRGVMFSPTAKPSDDYQRFRDKIINRISAGRAPSHFDSSLPADAFTGSPVVAYSLEDSIEDTMIAEEDEYPYDASGMLWSDIKIPAGYNPAYESGILTLGHELGHAGAKEVYDRMYDDMAGTAQESRAAQRLWMTRGDEELLMRAFDAAHRKPPSRATMGEFERGIEERAHKRHPNPLHNPFQSAAEKILRDEYAGRELYPRLPMQPR